MILKASQRGGGQDLARHLMRMDENDHVRLHELRGFASDTLADAFKEAEAVSRGTKCRQYLFSLSLSPPETESVPVAVFEDAIERVEDRLGLKGQPRAVVIHEKEGRRHAHCVWSRIDAETMTARQMSFFKDRLNRISRDLYLEHGWKMPRGLENAAERNPTNFGLAEWQQAKRQEMDPRWLKQTVQECWVRSDNRAAFERALSDRGFFLARGDKRGHVVLDHSGEIWALPRLLDMKTKEVSARLGDSEALPGVADARAVIAEKMTPALRRHVAESRDRFLRQSAKLGERKAVMVQAQRDARADTDIRQRAERDAALRDRTARLPKGLRGLWHRITGKYQEISRRNEAEAKAEHLRQAEERQKLIDRQLAERAALQAEFKTLRRAQAKELLELRKEIGRFWRFSRKETAPGLGRDHGLGLRRER